MNTNRNAALVAVPPQAPGSVRLPDAPGPWWCRIRPDRKWHIKFIGDANEGTGDAPLLYILDEWRKTIPRHMERWPQTEWAPCPPPNTEASNTGLSQLTE